MKHADPKENILNAAVKVFAARGFRDATVRDICRVADVNVSMVSYYFGSKEKLYAEVVRKLFSFTNREDLAHLADGVTDAASWRASIRRFLEIFYTYMTERSEPGVFTARIFRWEVTRPSSICEELMVTYGKTVYEGLRNLLAMAIDDPVQLKIWCGEIWSCVSMHAIADDPWIAPFRPKDLTREQWVAALVENQCGIIFKMLNYKGEQKNGH